MTVDFKRKPFKFGPITGSARIAKDLFDFPAKVLKAEAVISGSFFEFVGDDHPIYQLEANAVVTAIVGNAVEVEVTFGMRDHTGTWDDPYDGFVDVTVIAILGDPQ